MAGLRTAWHDYLAWAPDHPILHAAAMLVAGLFVATLLILLQILLLSARARRDRARRVQFDRQWRPRLALAGVGGELPAGLAAPRNGRQRLWWLMLWNRMQRQLRGDARERLNAALRALGLQRFAAQQLRGLGVHSRLVALETLRHLGDASLWGEVAPLLRARNPFVALAAAHALLAMAPARALALALEVAAEREDWGTQRLAGLCNAAGPELATPVLLRALDRADPALLARLAPLLASTDPVAAGPWVREALQRATEPQLLQSALAILGELADPRDHALIAGFGAHDDPDIRLAAVTALRRQARSDDIDVLLPLLADRSWWVRRETADAIAALPQMDAGALDALLVRVDDRYGRDQLVRAFAERGEADTDAAGDAP